MKCELVVRKRLRKGSKYMPSFDNVVKARIYHLGSRKDVLYWTYIADICSQTALSGTVCKQLTLASFGLNCLPSVLRC